MFKRLANGLADAGLSITLVLADAANGGTEGLSSDIRVIDLGRPRVFSCVAPLARFLDCARPRSVISTLHYANLVAVWARALSSSKPQLILREATTMSAAVANSSQMRDRLIPTLARLFYPRADAVVTNSQGSADDLIENIGLPRSLVRVVHNPACDEKIPALMQEPVSHPWFRDDGPPIALAVGRLSLPKRYDILIRAVASARVNKPLRLLIIGEGEERGRLEELVRKLGAEDYVSLAGYSPNPYAYMARSDLFVLSSAWEGLPNALIEALACGLPVVSTDCPSGPREILAMPHCGTGPIGTLVPPEDAEALAQGILKELTIRRDKVNLQERAQLFSTKKAVSAYIDLIHPGGIR